MERKGIDVSTYQGDIDWDKVKRAGIEFAILRCGFGSDFTIQDDDKFLRNIAECERVGMPYGIYIYSYALNPDMAHSEARHVLRMVGKHKPSYPIYYDLEDAKTTGTLSNEAILNIAKAFVADIESAGFWAGIYANLHWHTTKLTDSWYDTKARWVAQWGTNSCTYNKQFKLWQYTSDGKVDGINGRVDMNICYEDYPALINPSPSPSQSNTIKKTNEEVAQEVIRGNWGNGEERKKKLTAAGYDYAIIQGLVNKLMGKSSNAQAPKPKKSLETVAREVIRGNYGNGAERTKKLKAEGYDPKAVQALVNKMMK